MSKKRTWADNAFDALCDSGSLVEFVTYSTKALCMTDSSGKPVYSTKRLEALYDRACSGDDGKLLAPALCRVFLGKVIPEILRERRDAKTVFRKLQEPLYDTDARKGVRRGACLGYFQKPGGGAIVRDMAQEPKPWLETPNGAAALALCLGQNPAKAAAKAMRKGAKRCK